MIENYLPESSGDQDSVVPLMGSRTLVRELAKDLNFQHTVPYGAWFHKGQVLRKIDIIFSLADMLLDTVSLFLK